MGIQGLLSFLDKASRPAKISDFSGCSVAIDSYCWLHKGAFSCAEKLARGEKTDQYVKYCMKFVNMLLSYNIKPIMVFDGRHLPAKAETEKKRRELREANRKKAAELLRLERESEARSLIQRCVDVTHEMALALMHECRAMGVDCIVAPYEADAQLAYLNLNGLAHVVITEDSDLLLFGCKLVMFKMDLYGNGVLVEQSKIPICMKMHPNQFTMEKFRYMCILSGCDYLKSLPGIGLAKALKFIKKTQDNDISRALSRLGSYLNMANLEVTIDYREKFVSADLMFKHQPVFDPRARAMVPMTPLPPGVPDPLPVSLDPQVSYQLALGNLNPFSLERVDSWDPDQPQSIRTSGWKSTAHKHKSIWSKDYQLPKPLPPPPDPRDLKHNSTKGKSVVQPVTVLTEKISALPQKRNIEDELSRLREAYSAKAPPTKRLCLEESDSGLGTESSSEELTPNEVSPPRKIPPSPPRHSRSPPRPQPSSPPRKAPPTPPPPVLSTPPRMAADPSTELTVDDILADCGSPVLVGSQWKNPFRAKHTPKEESVKKALGGALDMFSKLKKTHVEAACVVQSRYFSSGVVTPEVKNPSPKTKEADLNESLLEIISSTPSPKKRNSLLSKRNLTPRKNIFEVIEMDEAGKNETSPSQCGKALSRSGTPRKNVFAITNSPELSASPVPSTTDVPLPSCLNDDNEGSKASPSPKRLSLLKILDEVSKETNDEESKETEVSPVKKTHSSLFKWSQPLLNDPKNKSHQNSLMGLYKPKSKIQVLPSKSPKNNIKKAVSSSPRGKPSLPPDANFKKKPPPTGGQASLLNMFAFQPKPKLK